MRTITSALLICNLLLITGCGKDVPVESEPPSAQEPQKPVVTPKPEYQPPALATDVVGEIDQERAVKLARDYLETWGKDLSQFNLNEEPSMEKVEAGDLSQWIIRWETMREPRIHGGVEVVVSSSGIGADYFD